MAECALRAFPPYDVAFARQFAVARAGAAALGHALQRVRVRADEPGLGGAALDDEPGAGVGGAAVAPALPAERDPDHRRRPRPGGAGGALAAARVGPFAALGEQADRGARREAVQADFGLPVALVGAVIEGAGFGAVRAAVARGGVARRLEVAPGLHAAVARRLAEQALGLGPALAEGVLDDLDAEGALAHADGDLGVGLGFGRGADAGAARVGNRVGEAAVETRQTGREPAQQAPMLRVAGGPVRGGARAAGVPVRVPVRVGGPARAGLGRAPGGRAASAGAFRGCGRRPFP